MHPYQLMSTSRQLLQERGITLRLTLASQSWRKIRNVMLTTFSHDGRGYSRKVPQIWAAQILLSTRSLWRTKPHSRNHTCKYRQQLLKRSVKTSKKCLRLEQSETQVHLALMLWSSGKRIGVYVSVSTTENATSIPFRTCFPSLEWMTHSTCLLAPSTLVLWIKKWLLASGGTRERQGRQRFRLVHSVFTSVTVCHLSLATLQLLFNGWWRAVWLSLIYESASSTLMTLSFSLQPLKST